MENESVFTFDKIINCPDYENAKDFSCKPNISIGIDPKQRVDKLSNPTLPVPAVEKEEEFNG